jgi:hypothetical protein
MHRTTQPIDPIVIDEQSLADNEPLTDEEIAQGFYTFNEMVERGFVKDRQDQRRKQLKYGFPRPIKTGDRQAPTPKARVHRWIRHRSALSLK